MAGRRTRRSSRGEKTFHTPRQVSPRATLAPCARSRAGLAPRRIARLGILVRRIKPRQLHALLHFAEHPALVEFVLGAFMSYEFQHVLRNNNGAVVVCHDDVAGKDGAATAADRLVRTHESQTADRSRRRNAGAPYR